MVVCFRMSRACFALRTTVPPLYGLFTAVMSYGVELWGSASGACSLAKKASTENKNVRLSHCLGAFREFKLLRLTSLDIFMVILTTSSVIGDLQAVSSEAVGLRSHRHRLTLRKHRHRLILPNHRHRLTLPKRRCPLI